MRAAGIALVAGVLACAVAWAIARAWYPSATALAMAAGIAFGKRDVYPPLRQGIVALAIGAGNGLLWVGLGELSRRGVLG